MTASNDGAVPRVLPDPVADPGPDNLGPKESGLLTILSTGDAAATPAGPDDNGPAADGAATNGKEKGPQPEKLETPAAKGDPGPRPRKDLEPSSDEETKETPLERALRTKPKTFFDPLLKPCIGPVAGKTLFLQYPRFFRCKPCGALLLSAGRVDGVYRLKCSCCGVTVAFHLALIETRAIIKQRLVKQTSETPAADEQEGPKRPPEPMETEPARGPNEATLNQGEPMREATQNDYAELLKIVRQLQRDLEESREVTRQLREENLENTRQLREEIQELRKENLELKTRAPKTAGPEATATAEPTEKSRVAPAPTRMTFRTVAAVEPRPQRTPETGPKAKPEPKPKAEPQVLTAAQLADFYQKRPKPQQVITTAYLTGIRAQRIKELRDVWKVTCGVSLRNILGIDFIGKSLTEVHIYADYVETFKRLLTETCADLHFVDVDPMDEGLLRKELAGNKTLAAAQKYHARLARRLEQTPSAAHRRFLRREMERAGAVLADRGNNAMAVESPTTTGAPTSQ